MKKYIQYKKLIFSNSNVKLKVILYKIRPIKNIEIWLNVFFLPISYLASGFDGFAESSAWRFTMEYMGDEEVLCRVHYKTALLNVTSYAQEWKIANATFRQEFVIVLYTQKHVNFFLNILTIIILIKKDNKTYSRVQYGNHTWGNCNVNRPPFVGGCSGNHLIDGVVENIHSGGSGYLRWSQILGAKYLFRFLHWGREWLCWNRASKMSK